VAERPVAHRTHATVASFRTWRISQDRYCTGLSRSQSNAGGGGEQPRVERVNFSRGLLGNGPGSCLVGILPSAGARHACRSPFLEETTRKINAFYPGFLLVGWLWGGSWGIMSGMGEVFEFEGHFIAVRRRRFQKRLGVSVYPNGQIRVSANKSMDRKEIVKFLNLNKVWLQKSLDGAREIQKKYPAKFFRSGEEYPYLGRDYKLQITSGETLGLCFVESEMRFMTPIPEDEISQSLRLKYYSSFKKSYRQVAEKIMLQRLQFYSHKMKLQPSAVQFRGQKSIWGSCSPQNKISLNFKLIVAPIEVVDYVIIHELAHIQHKNHSARFWKLVENFTEHRHFSRQWLRENQFKADFLAQRSELVAPASKEG